MRRVTWLIVGLAFWSLNAVPASAQPVQVSAAGTQAGPPAQQAAAAFPVEARLAFVDVDRVAALSAEGKTATARLHDLRNRKAAELATRSKHVEALQTKLSGGSAVLNDVARRRLEREFQRAQVDFQRLTEDAEEEVRELQQELMQAFTAKLFPVIEDIARERDLWAVFSDDRTTLWHNRALDLSEEVARRLDSTLQQGR